MIDNTIIIPLKVLNCSSINTFTCEKQVILNLFYENSKKEIRLPGKFFT